MFNLSLKADREKLEQFLSDDVNLFCETFYEQGHRNHMGASGLGEECWRKLWYDFRWTKEEHFDGRMMRLFNVGHSAEPRFVAYLRGIGFEVKEFEKDIMYHYYDEATNKDAYIYGNEQDKVDNPNYIKMDEMTMGYYFGLKTGIKPSQFRISGANDHYGGSLDGLCKPPAKYEVQGDIILSLSFKTNKDGSEYNKVAETDLQKSKPVHWAQECQYGYKMGIKYCIYMIENKNNSDLTFKVLELDWNYGAELEKKATTIINSKEPPPRFSENPATQKCGWCHQKGICHQGEQPEKNCRSCRNAMPTDNATWTCSIYGVIPSEFIKTGCPDNWLPI